MTTRTITFSEAQLRMIMSWAQREHTELDQARMFTIPDSPAEASAMADQLDVKQVMSLLRKT